MDQVLGDEPEQTGPVVLGCVDAEDLIKPEARIAQPPDTKPKVNNTGRDEEDLDDAFVLHKQEPPVYPLDRPKLLKREQDVIGYGALARESWLRLASWLKRDTVAENAVDAGVVKPYFLKCVSVAAVGQTPVERL